MVLDQEGGAGGTQDGEPRDGKPQDGEVIRGGATFLVSACVLAALLGAALFFSLPSNVLSQKSPGGPRQVFNLVASEQFPFFTKSPESANPIAYQEDAGGSVTSLMETPQGRPENWFGLRRLQRAQGPELGFLIADPEVRWTDCGPQLGDCLSKVVAPQAEHVVNRMLIQSVCGDVYLTTEVPVSWSFRHVVGYQRRVVKISHVVVDCPKD